MNSKTWALGNQILKNLQVIVKETPEIIKDQNRKLEIIKHYHDNLIFDGHIERKRLFFKIRKWKNMSRDIKAFVTKCQVNKAKIKNVEPLKITDTPNSSSENCN